MRLGTQVVLTALLGIGACSGGGNSLGSSDPYGSGGSPTAPADNNPAPSSPNTINANPGLAYNPTSLTVARGTTVNFVFGSVGHSVTFSTAGAPTSIPVTSNATVAVVFPTTGTFNFYCTVHSYMSGTVVVQ